MQSTAQILQFPLNERVADVPAASVPEAAAPETTTQAVPQAPPVIEDTPEEAEILGALRKLGIRRIHGLFEREAWANTIQATELYSMPFARTARANTAPIHNYAHQLHASNSLVFSTDYGKAAIKHFIRRGTLLKALFPRFREAEEHYKMVPIRFPRPPRAEMQLIQRAQLAGFKVRAAMPGHALSVNCNGISNAVNHEIDPILFATREGDELTAVLGYYNASPNDGPALKSLIALLDSMARDI